MRFVELQQTSSSKVWVNADRVKMLRAAVRGTAEATDDDVLDTMRHLGRDDDAPTSARAPRAAQTTIVELDDGSTIVVSENPSDVVKKLNQP